MKLPLSFLFPSLILFLPSGLCAQDIQLSRGKLHKTISVGSFIQIELPKPVEAICKNCPMNTVTGQFISTDDSTISIQVVESNQYLLNQSEHIGYEFKKYSEGKGPFLTIPKKDILSLIMKGKNKLHHEHPGDVVGAGLVNASVLTIFLTSLENGTPETVMVVTTATILASGIVMALSYQPFYKINTQSVYRKSIRKTWVLN